ncbi:HEAT repeat domain-containing protein [Amycolatopsis sp. NPDC101161]|uniref:HEAT repeat domain-containing protein n=1 Tax=Amycolatopsis sp. NPDC101161 TaxID=3363940 RepID=UPI00382138A8
MATPAALKAADDVHPVVRARAYRMLAKHGDHRALGRLTAACDSRHVHTALTGLARLADDSVAPTLVQVLLTTEERRVRKLAGRTSLSDRAQPRRSGGSPTRKRSRC